MAIELIKKRKTEPQCPQQHKAFVPLRVFEIRTDRLRDFDQKHGICKYVELGDIVVWMPSQQTGCFALLNCTKQTLIESRLFDNGAVRCLRAYDVQQVIISNDDEPAPIE